MTKQISLTEISDENIRLLHYLINFFYCDLRIKKTPKQSSCFTSLTIYIPTGLQYIMQSSND